MSSNATRGARARRAAWTISAAGVLATITTVAGCRNTEDARPAAAPVAETKAAPPPAAAATDAARPAASAGSGPVLATYDGKSFTLEDYRAAVGSLNTRARKSLDESPDRRKQFVENHIVSKLIFQEGVSRGLDKDPEIARRLEELREHLVVQQVMESQQNATVSDDEVKAYYESHKQEFSTEKVKASHILVDDEALAKEIVAKLRADKTQFAALAAEHSKDLSNAKRGGDLGYFGRGRMVKEFEEAAFALQNDTDISDPVQTRFGWHIIMRTGREQGSVQAFDQVKNQIKVKLVSEGRRERTTEFLDGLKKKAGLAVNEKELATATLGPAAEGGDDDKKPGGSGH
jgi:peptidyl-prolyl cis-trans isomerase C